MSSLTKESIKLLSVKKYKKRNLNADSCCVNTEKTDTGTLELLFPSQELSKSVSTTSIPDFRQISRCVK